jgi:hypothetical protein
MTYYAPKINPESSDPTRIFEKSTPVKKKRFHKEQLCFVTKTKIATTSRSIRRRRNIPR